VIGKRARQDLATVLRTGALQTIKVIGHLTGAEGPVICAQRAYVQDGVSGCPKSRRRRHFIRQANKMNREAELEQLLRRVDRAIDASRGGAREAMARRPARRRPGRRSPTLRCTQCRGLHGGVYGNLCPDCYTKSMGGPEARPVYSCIRCGGVTLRQGSLCRNCMRQRRG
jgi:hypothetical protein